MSRNPQDAKSVHSRSDSLLSKNVKNKQQVTALTGKESTSIQQESEKQNNKETENNKINTSSPEENSKGPYVTYIQRYRPGEILSEMLMDITKKNRESEQDHKNQAKPEADEPKE